MFVAQSCLTICKHIDCSLPGSSVHGFSRQEHWSGLPFPSPGDLPDTGIEPGSPALQPDTLPSEPPGKAKNPGVCSHSLLEGICLTQGLNRGLLHCRWILYQLSPQGSPEAATNGKMQGDFTDPVPGTDRGVVSVGDCAFTTAAAVLHYVIGFSKGNVLRSYSRAEPKLHKWFAVLYFWTRAVLCRS